MMKRKIEIAFETRKTVTWRRHTETLDAWCESCAAQSLMLGAQPAALRAKLSLRQICQQVESGNLHFKETEEGRLFICLLSLYQNPGYLALE
jgi:hypothetical protein